MTIERLLIANRGEIAVRVIRTCEALGIETVLCVSEADRHSLGAQMATRAVCIGPSQPAKSYLSVETVVQAAMGYRCDAIHPGYGFLSERADLARLCEEEGVIFIGPTAAQIEAVGDKLRARAEAISADVPVVPGGPVESAAEARALAGQIGAPLLVKAVGGGGGRGMKRVDDLARLEATMDMASAEASAAFGDARVYLERYVARGRHIEVQLLGDGARRVVHLGERDCSVQRRYQKLVEESPAPRLPPATRERLLDAAVRFAERLHYRGAGTVEFLYDVERDEFYFLEMNARIQVEHPVTEEVTGVDLVAEQIAIAAGDGLRLEQGDIAFSGAAIECRINAEDPADDFMPSPGTVGAVEWPDGAGIRVDTHIVPGAAIPPFYDSMIAKVIAHGPDRATALGRLRGALAATRIEGIKTNLAFQQRILADPRFAAGGVDTGFLARMLEKESA
ncbi:MAG TPA: acetyl-CoA carboxylase biotin carboxylase subunit [Croceibacterium sp.]|nr:acetyl-CoA carboxylase biotin carboxylase subunit [Croceibacterium sp.]